MLAAKMLAVVAAEVNLRNSLKAGMETWDQVIHLDFETQGRRHEKPKTTTQFFFHFSFRFLTLFILSPLLLTCFCF